MVEDIDPFGLLGVVIINIIFMLFAHLHSLLTILSLVIILIVRSAPIHVTATIVARYIDFTLLIHKEDVVDDPADDEETGNGGN